MVNPLAGFDIIKYLNPDSDKSYAQQFDESSKNTLAAQLQRQNRSQNDLVMQEAQDKIAREAEQRAAYAELAKQMGGNTMEPSKLQQEFARIAMESGDIDRGAAMIGRQKDHDSTMDLLRQMDIRSRIEHRNDGPDEKQVKPVTMVKQNDDGSYDFKTARNYEQMGNYQEQGYSDDENMLYDARSWQQASKNAPPSSSSGGLGEIFGALKKSVGMGSSDETPPAKSYGPTPNTRGAGAGQTKVVNGDTYVKVPGGWKRQ